MSLLTILAVLFITLIIAVPLLERFGKPHESEEVSGMSKWILPLAAILIVIQMFVYWGGN